jgi:hypothetical protein
MAYGNALTLISKQASAGTLTIKSLTAAVKGLTAKEIAHIAVINKGLIASKMKTEANVKAYLAKRGLTGALLEETTAQIMNTKAKNNKRILTIIKKLHGR